MNYSKLSSPGKVQRSEPSAASIPWEVCSVRSKFNSGAIVYPGFWSTMIGFCQVCFISPETFFTLKLQSSTSAHAGSAATEDTRTRLKRPCIRAERSWLPPCYLSLQCFLAVVTSRLPFKAEKKETVASLHISSPDKLLCLRHPKRPVWQG